jgi:phage-related protein
MAGEGVNIPISLEVTDISMDQVDLKDVEQKLTQKISGITKNVEKIMGSTDTSKFNKTLESSFKSLESSYSKVQMAQAKYNDAIRQAGESSEQYKAKLAEINGAIENQQSIIKSLAPHSHYKQAQEEIAKARQEIERLESIKPNPIDFVSSGSEASVTKVTQAYGNLLKAITGVDKAQKDWNTSLKENSATDEYQKMAQEIQTAEQKLAKLQDKAAKMQALGATDSQWESLVYDAQQLSNKITENESKMRKMVNTGKAFRFGDGGAAKGQEFMKLTGVLSRVQKSMQGINSMKPNTMYSNEYAKQLKELEALERKMASYKDKYQKMQAVGASNSQWKNFTADATILEGKIISIIAKLQEMVQAGSAFKLGTGDAGAEADALNSRLEMISNSFGEMKDAPKGTNNSITALSMGIKKFCESTKKGFSKVISMFKKLGKTSNRTSGDIGKSLKKITKRVVSLIFGVRSMYFLVRKLRTAFIESFKAMATQIPEINTEISSFMTSLNQLKGSIGTAFQPIVSAVIPWLNQLCSTLNRAMVAVGKFFATLTGQNYIYEFTADNVDYAESLKETEKSAKKAQKALMGFDEINRLDDNSDTGVDTGANGTWNKVDIEGATSSLAELIKKCWEQEDFTSLGVFLGEKLKLGLDTATSMIEGKILETGTKIANALATTINGFVSVDGLANSIGGIVGAAINTAMSILNTFLVTTNWLDVGKFIADAINGFVTKTDFSLIGQTVGNLVLAAINLFWSTITNIDFTNIGNKISEGINNVFTTLGATDITGLSGWQKLGQGISNAITGLLELMLTALQNIDWQQVGIAVGEFLGSIDWGQIVWDLTKLVASFVSGLCQAFASWAETDPLSAAIAGLLGTAILAIKVIPNIMELVDWVQKIAPHMDKVSTILTNIGTWLGKAFGAVKSFLTSTGGGIMLVITGTVTAVTSFFDMLKNGFSWLKEILMIIGIALAAVGAVILGAPAAIAAVIAAIVAVVMTAIVLIKEHWAEIVQFFKDLWEKVKTGVTEAWNKIKEFISTAWENIKTAVSTAIETVKTIIVNVVTGIFNAWKNYWTMVFNIAKSIFEAIKTAIETYINFVKTIIETVVNTIKGIWEKVWNGIKTFFTNIWEGITTGVSTAINAIKDTISKVIDSIKTFWTNTWNKIKETITGVWDKIKTTVSNVVTGVKDTIAKVIDTIKTKWETVWGNIRDKFIGIWDGIKSAIKNSINGIIGFVNNMMSAVAKGINTVTGALNKLSFDVPSWVPGIGGSTWGFNIPSVSAPQIPYLAKGAVIPPNQEFMAVLGDQKRGTNIEAPLSTIQEAVATVMDDQLDAMLAGFEAVVAAINNKDLTVAIGDREIGMASNRYNRRQNLVKGGI